MIPTSSVSLNSNGVAQRLSLKDRLCSAADDLLASLPEPRELTAEQRRGIIARYSSVLEGNFIYWMAATGLAVRSEEARLIVRDNLLEEVGDCHPGMMRRFAVSAYALPKDSDATAVYPQLAAVRLFIGRLSPVPLVAMMAFFENFIQRFMAYLGELATLQGSQEQEYTIVHGVCDVVHSQELFRALEKEMALADMENQSEETVLEGVQLLKALIHVMITDPAVSVV